MKVADLSKQVIEHIKTRRYDRILEKHEGPERWESEFEYSQPELLDAGGHWVLLPIDRAHHGNVTFVRVIESKDGEGLTIFLKDTTYTQPGEEFFSAGFLAVCEKVPGEELFVASVYHEWFMIGRGEPSS
jgi:hypothetical protein